MMKQMLFRLLQERNMNKRIVCLFLMAVLVVLPAAGCAFEVQAGDEVYCFDSYSDSEIVIETKTYDVYEVMKDLDEAEQRQIISDFIAAMMVVDLIQHDEYMQHQDMNVDRLKNWVSIISGNPDVRVENKKSVHFLWFSDLSYLKITGKADEISGISFVIPEIKNAYGEMIAVDFIAGN